MVAPPIPITNIIDITTRFLPSTTILLSTNVLTPTDYIEPNSNIIIPPKTYVGIEYKNY